MPHQQQKTKRDPTQKRKAPSRTTTKKSKRGGDISGVDGLSSHALKREALEHRARWKELEQIDPREAEKEKAEFKRAAKKAIDAKQAEVLRELEALQTQLNNSVDENEKVRIIDRMRGLMEYLMTRLQRIKERVQKYTGGGRSRSRSSRVKRGGGDNSAQEREAIRQKIFAISQQILMLLNEQLKLQDQLSGLSSESDISEISDEEAEAMLAELQM